jgi:nucleotide-binding universal stress UspA family protein
MIKDIIVCLSTDGSGDTGGDYAISLGKLFDAHVSAFAFAFIPVVPQTPIMDAFGANFIDAQRSENRKAAQAAGARFEEGLKRAGVRGASLLLESGVAEAAKHFGQIARRFDLVAIGQAEPSRTERQILIERALFESGRPLVVVPYIQKGEAKLDQVMVCWDGSRAAARAVADAMPLLARAKKVEVVTISGEAPKSEEIEGADIGEHLARHDLKVEINRIVAREGDVASTILSHAADSAADFVVMGGYGHSRFREFVLGGATRGMLAAMTVPVLMSH